MGVAVGEMGEKGEGIKMYKLQNVHRDVKYNIGNIVHNIVITMYDTKWVLDLPSNQFVNYINV